ncbi:isocitrate lyase/PEP mutase family protein [Phreatobacter sp. AB_2022a]|uniref:isocitrate lyase/PEP mutase family protein n=1 Tax=Phreatobacter sp. AB_2022a TaxID=3003134 RepID=UPI00228758AC|nr:isocitrate lyase/phosphoenolpyruvate mutase family protein [Phreatobacter sp. AB_2022a]MCZ0736780.1 isocitrate lyase/phosphoenolpyruvate mutase family protein [Phreatobacter sp. AB_2022a]
MDVAARRAAFRRLHETGCFVIPNPWDTGSAMMLKHLGFKALATTSSGFSFSRGLPDMDWAVPRDMALGHIAEIVQATDLPVNADFESGYGHAPEAVAENVRLCAATGVAGLSIEDNSGDPGKPLYDFDLALARIEAAVKALAGTGVLLTARCEAHLVGHPDAQAEAVKRLKAFAAAGADVLYAPGIRSREHIGEVMAAAGGKPVNLLISGPVGLSVADAAALGVRRISVGSALARAAWGGFLKAARELADAGTFNALGEAEPFGPLNTFFKEHGVRP